MTDTDVTRPADLLPRLDDAAADLGSLGNAEIERAAFAAQRQAWRERGLVNVGTA